jgi:hypothetical protein
MFDQMAVNKETSNAVNIDWENALPQLTLYAKNKLYKRVRPLIAGIELIKLPMSDEYSPHFVIYPLWKKTEGRENKFGLSDYFK